MTTGRINQVTTDPIRRPMRAVGRTDGHAERPPLTRQLLPPCYHRHGTVARPPTAAAASPPCAARSSSDVRRLRLAFRALVPRSKYTRPCRARILAIRGRPFGVPDRPSSDKTTDHNRRRRLARRPFASGALACSHAIREDKSAAHLHRVRFDARLTLTAARDS